jgi:hypothetical protein
MRIKEIIVSGVLLAALCLLSWQSHRQQAEIIDLLSVSKPSAEINPRSKLDRTCSDQKAMEITQCVLRQGLIDSSIDSLMGGDRNE